MHIHNLYKWQHSHTFEQNHAENERQTLRVILLTVSMMVIEITGGTIFGSMALLADGWHMGTHAAALGITMLAYVYARRLSGDRRYTFGTGKVSVLGGFTSGVVLLVIAVMMAVQALERLVAPQPIRFDEAIFVAVVGLCVNLFSAFLLRGEHSHAGHHGYDEHHHGHTDHNLKAAYLHVIADALTSVLAIAALFAGKLFGWIWMDALMGVVGSIVITRWSVGLLRETGEILLDRGADEHLEQEIHDALEHGSDTRIVDLHVWQIGADQYSAIISVVTHYPQPVDAYREQLKEVHELVHVTIEVYECTDEPCLQPDGEPVMIPEEAAGNH